MVFLHCANLAALELSPRIPFPICFSAGVGQERDCVRLGRWKRNCHYEPKVLVVADGERMLQVRPHALVRVQISAVLSSRDSRVTSQCGLTSLWPLSLRPSSWSRLATGYPLGFLESWNDSRLSTHSSASLGKALLANLQRLALAGDFFLFSSHTGLSPMGNLFLETAVQVPSRSNLDRRSRWGWNSSGEQNIKDGNL